MIVPTPDQRTYDLFMTGYSGSTAGNGSASVLPMTDAEKAKIKPKPLGFAPTQPTPKTRRKAKP